MARRDGPWSTARIMITALVAVLIGAAITSAFLDWLRPGLFRATFAVTTVGEIAILVVLLALLNGLGTQRGTGH